MAQPTDTRDESGIFSQNLQFLFSHYDNRLRRKRAIDTMRNKFEKGIWVTKPPQGYDTVIVNGERKLIINETGKKIRRAFLWKAEGMKNEEIIARMKAMDVAMYKQQLTKIFKKPFYCGILNHGLLDGKVVQGVHEPLISQETFLQVNNIHRSNALYGVPHKKESDLVPFKVFIKCNDCNQPFTGYIVKAKNLWYYKCRTKGCKCNRSAVKLHAAFTELLSGFRVEPHLVPAIAQQLHYSYLEMNKEKLEQGKLLRSRLVEVEKKMENIEEKYFVSGDMSREVFEKFSNRFQQERLNISQQIEKYRGEVSNPEKVIASSISLYSKLATIWTSGNLKVKETLQNLLFPSEIIYDRKLEVFRTDNINSSFGAIASLKGVLEDNEKGGKHFL